MIINCPLQKLELSSLHVILTFIKLDLIWKDLIKHVYRILRIIISKFES